MYPRPQSAEDILVLSVIAMTITYNAEVFTSRIGIFWKLLGRWRGSIYKLVWKELMVYMVLYGALSLIYRLVLGDYSKDTIHNVLSSLSFCHFWFTRGIMRNGMTISSRP